MTTCTFVEPPTPLARCYMGEIEATIARQWSALGCDALLCHPGVPEVSFADAVPGRGILDATLVCTCTRPCAVLRRLPGDPETWQCVALPEPFAPLPSIAAAS